MGLDAQDLLEITLDSGAGSYLVPAHVWTPWFGILGSKSGFDDVDDCYADLAGQVFALETGLSWDPEMNWRVSRLDRFRLVSPSDAHSPPILGRNVTVFDTALDYWRSVARWRPARDTSAPWTCTRKRGSTTLTGIAGAEWGWNRPRPGRGTESARNAAGS